MRARLLSPNAILSGVFTFGLLLLQAAVARAVLPHLIELVRTAPRLAMLGFLALMTLPTTLTFLVHRLGSRWLDRYAAVEGSGKTVESLWAGALVGLVLYGSTLLTRLLLLVVYPPRPEPDVFSLGEQALQALEEARPANTFSLAAGLFILVAASLFELEHRAKKPR